MIWNPNEWNIGYGLQPSGPGGTDYKSAPASTIPAKQLNKWHGKKTPG
jgi:hypothetical protein